MGELRGNDRLGRKSLSCLRPCKSGANLLGLMLPRAMLQFWCTQEVFLKKACVCTYHALHTGCQKSCREREREREIRMGL